MEPFVQHPLVHQHTYGGKDLDARSHVLHAEQVPVYGLVPQALLGVHQPALYNRFDGIVEFPEVGLVRGVEDDVAVELSVQEIAEVPAVIAVHIHGPSDIVSVERGVPVNYARYPFPVAIELYDASAGDLEGD